MRLLYTKRVAGLPEGFSIRNPDYFLKPENGAKHVTIEGEYPVIAEAYEKEGTSVEVVDNKAVETTKELSDMSLDELKAHLTEQGVEFAAKATKQQLLELAKEG
ncbi:hypothetical protein GGR41_000558 [Paenalcaligenes hominis]|uniref:T4 recombination endonuclease VII dimerisation domain-containing protein n=1 Tax=Paenalcaligenes hominis TaxID=643674 RepID=A0ABX0WQD2_9BURK|nr:hypothetical protein [Paenalcaligenes hominis]NJB64337.1 hypothetical protein [Paenalcaligenes hominis]GGE68431.1 hypothetical protein GCM10007278_15640 [Paenalcaligenes hominis]